MGEKGLEEGRSSQTWESSVRRGNAGEASTDGIQVKTESSWMRTDPAESRYIGVLRRGLCRGSTSTPGMGILNTSLVTSSPPQKAFAWESLPAFLSMPLLGLSCIFVGFLVCCQTFVWSLKLLPLPPLLQFRYLHSTKVGPAPRRNFY
jgi:hypothetical protein